MKKIITVGITATMGLAVLGGFQNVSSQQISNNNSSVSTRANSFSQKFLKNTVVNADEQSLVSRDAIRINFSEEYLYVTNDGRLATTHNFVTRNINRVRLIKADGTVQDFNDGKWLGLQLHVGDQLKVEINDTWGTVKNPGVNWTGSTRIDAHKIYAFTFNSATNTNVEITTIENQVPRDALRIDFGKEYLYVTNDGKLAVTNNKVVKNIGRVRLIEADGTVQDFSDGKWLGLQLHIGDQLKVEINDTWGTVKNPGVNWTGSTRIDPHKIYAFTFNSATNTNVEITTIENQVPRDALRIDFGKEYLYVTNDGKLAVTNNKVVKNIGRVRLIEADGTVQDFSDGKWLGLQLHIGDQLKVEINDTWGTVKNPGVNWTGSTRIDPHKIYAFTFNSATNTNVEITTIENQVPRDALRIDFGKEYLYVTNDGKLAVTNNKVINNIDRVKLIKTDGTVQDFSDGKWVGLQLHIGDTLNMGINGIWGTVRSPGVNWTGSTKIEANRNYSFTFNSVVNTTVKVINYD